MQTKIPKKADDAIKLLESLVEQLHYFYNGHEDNFKKNVLKDAAKIENTLKELAVNKTETFTRISKRYEEYYKKKQAALDDAMSNVTDTKLNDSVKQKYRQDFKKDRT